MNNKRIFIITGHFIAIFLVLGLLLDFATAQDKVTLGEQLIKASEHGDLTQVKTLLDKGADVNTKTEEGWTPLIVAASVGRANVLDLLIGRGADVNARRDDGSTALLIAAEAVSRK